MLRLTMGGHQTEHKFTIENDAKNTDRLAAFRAVAPEGVRLGRGSSFGLNGWQNIPTILQKSIDIGSDSCSFQD
jgi:hypothetical protein